MGVCTQEPAWRIRPFTMDDYDSVYQLWREAGPGIELRPSDRRHELEKKLALDPDLFLAAEENGSVVAVIMGAWDGRRGWLHHLAVAGTHRGRGIATALISEVEAQLRAKGCLKVNLLVRRENVAARSLYGRLGYDEMPTIVAMGKEL